MKLGIIGAGRIGRTVSATLKEVPEIELYAIGSKDLARAEAFAKEVGFLKAYGSYEDLYNDPEVELIYVCTPHTEHAQVMKDAIMHGKNVICEKPFTVTAAEAEEVIKLAREKGVYLAEAMWPRYTPARKIITDTLNSGIIGDISMVTGVLSYDIMFKERIIRKELAGGALLDLGIYGISFALEFLGDDIKTVDSTVIYTDTGVDQKETISIVYNDGKLVSLLHSVDANACRNGIFHGTKGYLVIDNIHNPSVMDIFDDNYCLIKHEELPIRVSGYEYEFEEAVAQIRKGEKESTSISLDETLRQMQICDMVKNSWNNK